MAARDPHYVTPDGRDGGPVWSAPPDAEQTLIDGPGVRRRVDPSADGPRDRHTAGHRTASGPRLASVPTWTQQHPRPEPEPEPEQWEPPHPMPPRPPEPEPAPVLSPDEVLHLVRDAIRAETPRLALELARRINPVGRRHPRARIRRALAHALARRCARYCGLTLTPETTR